MISDVTIPAKHFAPGRVEPVRCVVLHTTESGSGPGSARAVARWFAGAAAPQASAHFIVGVDEVVACVDEADTAWHAPPANDYAIGIEHTARAAWTTAEWGGELAQKMLARSAALVADLCTRYQLPVTFVDAAGLVRGEAGITTHAEVSKAFHRTDHTDPGAAFDMDAYLAMVEEAAPTVDRAVAQSG